MEFEQNTEFSGKEGFQPHDELTQKRQYENAEIAAVIEKRDD